MAREVIYIQFVWLESDWPGGPPVPYQAGDSSSAFEVAQADPRQVAVSLATRSMPSKVTVGQALQTCLTKNGLDRLSQAEVSAAVFGRRARPDQPLYDGDRIELLGPITADPKGARHARVQSERQSSERDKWRTGP
ncbi:MAG: RnfH family protein [Burkholderiaceae bacterium]